MLTGVSIEQALLLHGCGFSIIPVPVGEKVPVIAWKYYQTERATAAMVAEWCSTPTNIAIVCGAVSGVVVVDCDSDDALAHATRRLPWTPRQVKTPRGWHLYYRHPGVPVRNRARIQTGDGAIALDVRGDGGYVISPFSLHASGEMYHPVADWDAPAGSVPVFDPAWLAAPAAERRERASRTYTSTASVLDRARKYLASIPAPEIGMGSDAASLYAACRLARGFALPEADAVALLDEWAGGRPGWDSDWLATKVRHALKYGSEPIGALL